MKECFLWKTFLIKVVQQPQKSLRGSNQIWTTTSDKKGYIAATSIYIYEFRIEVAVVGDATTAIRTYLSRWP